MFRVVMARPALATSNQGLDKHGPHRKRRVPGTLGTLRLGALPDSTHRALLRLLLMALVPTMTTELIDSEA